MKKNELKYMMYCLPLVFLILSISNAFTQNTDEDLKKISLKYKQVEKIMVNKTINYYNSYKGKEPEQTSKTILKKTNNQLYTNVFDVETVVNNGISVLVDHKSKTILVDENDVTELNKSLDVDFTAIKELSDEINYKKKNGEGCYTFYFKTGEHLKSELWFNSDNYEVTKIVYYLRDALPEEERTVKKKTPPRLEILITTTIINCEFDANTFALEQFVVRSDNGIHPITKYKNYKLINNIGY